MRAKAISVDLEKAKHYSYKLEEEVREFSQKVKNQNIEFKP